MKHLQLEDLVQITKTGELGRVIGFRLGSIYNKRIRVRLKSGVGVYKESELQLA